MAKYKLKALNFTLKGILFKKEDNVVFDTEKKHKALKEEIEQACKKGFLIPVSSTEIIEEVVEEMKNIKAEGEVLEKKYIALKSKLEKLKAEKVKAEKNEAEKVKAEKVKVEKDK